MRYESGWYKTEAGKKRIDTELSDWEKELDLISRRILRPVHVREPLTAIIEDIRCRALNPSSPTEKCVEASESLEPSNKEPLTTANS